MAALKIRLKDEVINQLKEVQLVRDTMAYQFLVKILVYQLHYQLVRKFYTRLVDDENYVRLKLSKIESRSLTDYQYTNIANIWAECRGKMAPKIKILYINVMIIFQSCQSMQNDYQRKIENEYEYSLKRRLTFSQGSSYDLSKTRKRILIFHHK